MKKVYFFVIITSSIFFLINTKILQDEFSWLDSRCCFKTTSTQFSTEVKNIILSKKKMLYHPKLIYNIILLISFLDCYIVTLGISTSYAQNVISFFQVIYQKLVLRASSGYPNMTEKETKAWGRRPNAFIVSRCLDIPIALWLTPRGEFGPVSYWDEYRVTRKNRVEIENPVCKSYWFNVNSP